MPESRELCKAANPSTVGSEGGEVEHSFETILGRSNGRSAWDFGRKVGWGVFSFSDLLSNDWKNLPACLKIVYFDSELVNCSTRIGLGGDGRSSSSEE